MVEGIEIIAATIGRPRQGRLVVQIMRLWLFGARVAGLTVSRRPTTPAGSGSCSSAMRGRAPAGLDLNFAVYYPLTVVNETQAIAIVRSGTLRISGVRVLWLGLPLVHIRPALMVVWRLWTGPSLETLGSLAALVGVTAFFGAKAADVALLRSDRPRLELLAWLSCA